MKLNKEQLQFFFDEVLGELGWHDEIEETGIDPLAYVRDEISGLRRQIKQLQVSFELYSNSIKKLEHDNTALFGALGNPVPEGHNGLLSDGTEPKNVLAEYLASEHSVRPTGGRRGEIK